MQDGQKVQKGLKTILTERGFWDNCLSLSDTRKLLQAQPDFLAQQEWLPKIMQESGFLIDFYPKFHCKLNFIEMYWRACKS
jgi:hypothetical protein